jgi:hypothetical protein
MIILQLVGMSVTTIGVGASFYWKDLVKPLLYIQAAQMTLSNFNSLNQENSINFVGLNMLSTVFSVYIAIFNCYLASIVIDDFRIKAVSTFLVFAIDFYTIIQTNFIFTEDITYHSVVCLAISIIYTCIMVPAFGYISQKI